MAKFPIVQSTRSLPGEVGAVRAHMDTRTGAAGVAAAAGQLGGQTADIAMRLYREEGQTELANAKLANDELAAQTLLGLDGKTDTTTYASEANKAIMQIQGREMKNGYARKQYGQIAAAQSAQLKYNADKMRAKRIKENALDVRINTWAKAIETGNPADYVTLRKTDIAEGRATDTQLEIELRELGPEIRDRQIENLAIANASEVFGMSFEEAKREIPGLESAEYAKLQRMAGVQAANERRKRDAYWNSILENTYADAVDMDYDRFREKLLRNQNVTAEERDKLMQVYLASSARFNKTGVNPWEHTQDYGSLMTTMMQIQRGDIKTLGEVDNLMYPDGDSGPQWSFNDWRRVTKLWVDFNTPSSTGGKGYTRTHPLVKPYFDELNEEFSEKKGLIPFFTRTELDMSKEYVRAYAQMEAAFKNMTDLTDKDAMDKILDDALKNKRQDDAKGWLSWAQRWVAGNHPFAGMERMPPGIPRFTPETSQAEYNALPEGAYFLYEKELWQK